MVFPLQPASTLNVHATWGLAALLALAAGLAHAGGAVPAAVAVSAAPALSFAQAQQLLLSNSDQLAAAARAVESARLRRAGVQGLGGPSVAVTGMAYRYAASADIDLDLDPARQALGGIVSMLPPPLGGAISQLPQLPPNYSLERQDSRAAGSVSLLWPLYIGGLGDAVRSGFAAQADEAQADASADAQGVQSLLVQRYFGAQLAERAARLREAALATVREHDAAAERMLATGVISRLERLQAQAALADAAQQARKARDEAQLAATALARTLKVVAPLRPSSPLFVASQPLPALQGFIDAALAQHPGLSKVQAKRREAAALHDAQEALRKPQVLGFGQSDIRTGGGKPNWVAGVAVRWTLWDSIDRDKLSAAGQRKVEQAELTDAQVRSDIALLVEKNWLAVEQSRTQYLSGQAQEDLARELLRLRAAGLKEGTSTALELIDAQLNLAKVQTERAAAANQYVQALAALLESTGQTDDFTRYMARADIQIKADAP